MGLPWSCYLARHWQHQGYLQQPPSQPQLSESGLQNTGMTEREERSAAQRLPEFESLRELAAASAVSED